MHLYNETMISTKEGRHEEHGKSQIHRLTPHKKSGNEREETVAEGRLRE